VLAKAVAGAGAGAAVTTVGAGVAAGMVGATVGDGVAAGVTTGDAVYGVATGVMGDGVVNGMTTGSAVGVGGRVSLGVGMPLSWFTGEGGGGELLESGVTVGVSTGTPGVAADVWAGLGVTAMGGE